MSDDNDIVRFVKFNRWLGFIQGSLWLMGLKTVTELREHVKSWDNNGDR